MNDFRLFSMAVLRSLRRCLYVSLSIPRRTFHLVFFLAWSTAFLSCTNAARHAQAKGVDAETYRAEEQYLPLLSSHEPNRVGYAIENANLGHLDFLLSLKFPLGQWGRMLQGASPRHPTGLYENGVFGAVSLRASQYIGTRDSSPVVGRRFNPEFFYRYRQTKSSYLDLGFGHESNGQNINTELEFDLRRQALARDGDSVSSATDYLSRGWDYLGIRKSGPASFLGDDIDYIFQGRLFLRNGPFQGEAEDYYDFETSARSFHRRDFDGILFGLRGQANNAGFSVFYSTGYSSLFEHHTLRAEVRYRFQDLAPFIVWYQTGYNSDLAHYYQRTQTLGAGIELW